MQDVLLFLMHLKKINTYLKDTPINAVLKKLTVNVNVLWWVGGEEGRMSGKGSKE